MAACDGTVHVCEQSGYIFIRVTGWGRMDQSLPLRRYTEKSISRGGVRLRVDLRQCTYLDSTFLGTLLHLQRLARRDGGELALVAPSPECQRLFHQLGIEQFFGNAPADEVPAAPWQELTADRGDAQAFNRTVIEAHQELAGLGGRAGEQFQAVARCLTRDGAKTANPAEEAS